MHDPDPLPGSAAEDTESAPRLTLDEISQEMVRRMPGRSEEDYAFFAAAAKLIRAATAGMHPSAGPEQIQAYLRVAQWFFESALDPWRGLEAASEAVACARRIQRRDAVQKDWLRRALTYQAALSYMSGNSPRAVEYLSESLELAEELGDDGSVLKLLYNLSAALLDLSQFGDAARINEAILKRTEGDPTQTYVRAAALAGIALCCLRRRDIDAGLSAVQKAIDLLDTPSTAEAMAIRVAAERNYVWLLLRKGLVGLATERARLAREIASGARSLTADIAAGIASVLVDNAAGNARLAEGRLNTLMEQARLLKPAMQEALIAAVEISIDAGLEEAALSFERELAVHLQQDRRQRTLHHHSLRMRELAHLPRPSEWGEGRYEWLAQRCSTLEQFAVAATLPTDASGGHPYRVAALLFELATAYGLSEEACFCLELAARLHDIGNQFVPDHVLQKAGPLSHVQRQLIQMHTVLGADLIAKAALPPELEPAEHLARFHHERWDGSGYPMRLKGGAIPLEARMIAIADTFDALVHDRPHRTGCTVPQALAEVSARAGTQFDPYLAGLFVSTIKRLHVKYDDLDSYLGRLAPDGGFVRAKSKVLGRL